MKGFRELLGLPLMAQWLKKKLFPHANRQGNNGNSDKSLFSWAPKSLQMVTAAIKLKDTCCLEGKL